MFYVLPFIGLGSVDHIFLKFRYIKSFDFLEIVDNILKFRYVKSFDDILVDPDWQRQRSVALSAIRLEMYQDPITINSDIAFIYDMHMYAS